MGVNIGAPADGFGTFALQLLDGAESVPLEISAEAELTEAQTGQLVNAKVAESTSRGEMLKIAGKGLEQQMLASAAGQWTNIGLQVGQLIGGIVGLHFQGMEANLKARLQTRMMALTEDVAEHRMQLEDKVVDAQVAATDKKMELAKVLAKTKKDLQVELAKIQAGALVQVELGRETANLFLKQPNYGNPVIRAV